MLSSFSHCCSCAHQLGSDCTNYLQVWYLDGFQATTPENLLSSNQKCDCCQCCKLAADCFTCCDRHSNPGHSLSTAVHQPSKDTVTVAASSQRDIHIHSQQSQSQQNGPDLSKLSPRLQQQFDHVQNAHLGNIVIAKFSAIQVAWICDQCPSGYPHKWVQTPDRRTSNDGCPFCSGRRVCKHNSLATKSHAATASWDYSANEGTPDDYTAGINYRATWLSWQTRIKDRALGGTGCPHCYELRRGRKADGSRTITPQAIIPSWQNGTRMPMRRLACVLRRSSSAVTSQ